jgi:excisionase family DNA binding protein
MISTATDTAPRMLLSVAEVAAELGCGRDTVYTLLGNGALPSVRLGGRLRRIRRCDLERFVAQMHPSLPTCPVARPASRSTAASSR